MPSWNACPCPSLKSLLALGLLAALAPAGAQQPSGDPPPAAPEVAPADAPTPDGPRDLDELLAAFARVEGLEARFVEEQQLALLAAPLVHRGRLYYLRPGHLTRVQEGPDASTVRISPEHLHFEDAHEKRSIRLAEAPQVRVLVTSLVAVFSGQRALLEQDFTLTFAPDGADGWSLRLQPRTAPLDQLLRELRLSGRGFAVECIERIDPNGDRSLTRLQALDTRRVFSAAERHELFGLAP